MLGIHEKVDRAGSDGCGDHRNNGQIERQEAQDGEGARKHDLAFAKVSQ